MTRKIRLLIVDDEADAVDIAREILEDCGYAVTTATSGKQAALLIQRNFFDLLVLDEQMKDMTGSALLAQCKERYPDIGAIFLTGHGDVETAVRALQLGALDFLRKPIDRDKLVDAVRGALERSEIARENRLLWYDAQAPMSFGDIIGKSRPMLETLELVRQVIPTGVPVLVQGESGTGKELVARAIHFNGPRRQKPFIPINAAAIPQPLVESTLFGHRKGAFTDAKENKTGCFEAAGGGTVFLDEVGELTHEVQVKLLRVLQEKAIVRVGDVVEIPVDVRIVAATNRDLKGEVGAGRFRNDLFYRLAVITINIPPLRSRGDDVVLLTKHLLEKNRKELGKPIQGITEQALERLRLYHWPGNIRELDNVIQRAIILARTDTITPDLLLLEPNPSSEASPLDISDLSFREAQIRFERKYFSDLLNRAGGSKTKAAELAQMNRAALYEHLDKIGLRDNK